MAFPRGPGRRLFLVPALLVTVALSVAGRPVSLLPGRAFVAVWNAPTSRCMEKYGVDLDLDPFDIVVNQDQKFVGSEMVIFYRGALGLYPYYDLSEQPINGGLPQNASLKDHIYQAYANLTAAIPSPDFSGVAVIDWEEWRPLWDRNWDAKDIYRRHSEELVQEQHPDWPADKVAGEAKRQFEDAASRFMAATLELGTRLRPGGLWGYYGFPGCYNYGYKKDPQNYTGECPPAEVARNDQLQWLWAGSRTLYPDIYLEAMLKDSRFVGPYVKHRLLEALRVAAPGDLPVLPYARMVYTFTMDFLTQDDLMKTIGESAALGTDGVILWGNNDYQQSKEACLAVKEYIDNILGMYVVNVTRGAELCSHAVCAGKGRCTRKDPASNALLHLNPASFTIQWHPGVSGFLVTGEPLDSDLAYMTTHFHCRCYPGWGGPHCSTPRHHPPTL